MAATERRIILLGKTGNGKSSTGNSLLGREEFDTCFGLTASTQRCHLGKTVYRGNNMRYTIVDTPGLMSSDLKLADSLLEIQRSIEICPEPHAFLLIFSSTNRLTTDEEFTIDLLRVTFGEKVFDHCIIVFTHGIHFSTAQEFSQFWKQSEVLVQLAKECGDRITRIENKSSEDPGRDVSVNRITKMIEAMSDGGKVKYQYKYLGSHKQVLLKHLQEYVGTGNIHEEISSLVRALGEVLKKEVWIKRLACGALLSVTGATVAATAYNLYLASVAPYAIEAGMMDSVLLVGYTVGSATLTLASKLRFW